MEEKKLRIDPNWLGGMLWDSYEKSLKESMDSYLELVQKSMKEERLGDIQFYSKQVSRVGEQLNVLYKMDGTEFLAQLMLALEEEKKNWYSED